jgi:integrase
MSLFKRGSTYHYDFILNAERQQGTTKLKNRRDAQDFVDELRVKLVREHNGFITEKPKPTIKMPTFRQQSEVWINHLCTRNRRPIPDSSVPSIRGALNRWLLPTLGALSLSEVNHTALRTLVQKMAEAKLAPKTICTYIVMAKQIVASLADDDGQPIVSRQWDNERIDLPLVNKRNQRRATLDKEQIEALVGVCDEAWERTLYMVCCATGLRISEALALDREHLSDDFSVIYVRQQVKANRIVPCLKTDAAWRDVDLDPRMVEVLRGYLGNRTGLLFPTRAGTPRSYSNLYNQRLRPKLESLGFYLPGAGAHCFRRFRAAQLKRAACPDDLRKFWLGHANGDISDHYALQLLEDVERRRAVAAQRWTRLRGGGKYLQFSLHSWNGGPAGGAKSLRTIEHNFAEHLALLHVLVGGADILKRKRPVHHRFQPAGEHVAQHIVEFAHRAHV